jgi:hypothetical protein
MVNKDSATKPKPENRTSLPNLIIPGAQKSATSSLARLLETHRGIYLGRQKEPHFFSKDRKYQKGLDLYRSYYPDHQGQPIILDASQSYMPLPFVPMRVDETLGRNIRLIFSLRNPLDRVISAFSHYKIRGRGEIRNISDLTPKTLNQVTLESLLAYEKRAVHKGLKSGQIESRNDTFSKHNFPFNYFYASCYSVHIAQWLEIFPKTHFLFLTFEEVTQKQRSTVCKVAEFLKIDPTDFDTNRRFHQNPSLEYKSEIFKILLPLQSLLSRTLTTYQMEKLSGLGRKWFKKKPHYEFSKETRHKLTRIFRPEIRRTEELTGLDLSAWTT